MDTKFNFVWEITEEGLEQIRNDEQESGVFASVYVGRILVEFRCSNDGCDDERHNCITDIFIYGKYNETYSDWEVNGIPYCLYEYADFVPPKRRTINGFQKAVERILLRTFNNHPMLMYYATKNTEVEGWK